MWKFLTLNCILLIAGTQKVRYRKIKNEENNYFKSSEVMLQPNHQRSNRNFQATLTIIKSTEKYYYKVDEIIMKVSEGPPLSFSLVVWRI